MRGRKALSNRMKLLKGSREPLNPAEPVLPVLMHLEPPEALSEAARAVWAECIPQLAQAGVVTVVDACRFEALGRQLLDEAEALKGRKRDSMIRLAALACGVADKVWVGLGVADPRERARMSAPAPERDDLAAFKRRHAGA
jgi:hypothetical protein